MLMRLFQGRREISVESEELAIDRDLAIVGRFSEYLLKQNRQNQLSFMSLQLTSRQLALHEEIIASSNSKSSISKQQD